MATSINPSAPGQGAKVQAASRMTGSAHLFSGAVAPDNGTLKHVALPLAREHKPRLSQHPTPLS